MTDICDLIPSSPEYSASITASVAQLCGGNPNPCVWPLDII